MKISEEFAEIFYPSGIKCLSCADDIPKDSKYPICKKCKLETNINFCLTCGRNTTVGGQYCVACKSKMRHFKIARAPFIYKGQVKRLIHKLKYGNGKYIAKEMAVYLADTYYEHSLMSDIITYVPMFFKKEKRRGYNQAKLLAEALADFLGLKCSTLLKKIVDGKSLAKQNASQRAIAIKDTFEVVLNFRNELKGKRVLLIDDVFTTGATSSECAKILTDAKAVEVNVLTLATAVQSEKPSLKRNLIQDL